MLRYLILGPKVPNGRNKAEHTKRALEAYSAQRLWRGCHGWQVYSSAVLRIVSNLTIALTVPRIVWPNGEYGLLGSKNSRGLKPAAILPFV